MKRQPPSLLRSALTLLIVALGLASLPAAARSSDGSDGEFHPTVTTILDSSRLVFNFTDIIIPRGVSVSFSALAGEQPIALLATGIIDIAGVLDGGDNSLSIETPGTISISGSLDGPAIALLAAGRIHVSDTARVGGGVVSGGSISLAGGGTIALAGHGTTVAASAVPEPASGAMLLAGIGLLLGVARRRSPGRPGPSAA